jgi:TetR/AcrR family transcriptional regulator, transcriptional repressor of bet genes
VTRPAPRFRRYSSEIRASMLIEAGLACLGRGGITAFTIDNICREAGASRGLITHHFGSKDALLAAVYSTAYRRDLTRLAPDPDNPPDLVTLIDRIFDPASFYSDGLRIWLALWGEIATNPALKEKHHLFYAEYRAIIAGALERHAKVHGLHIDAPGLALTLIALMDGLWLELCLSPEILSAAGAKAACIGMIVAQIGPLQRGS